MSLRNGTLFPRRCLRLPGAFSASWGTAPISLRPSLPPWPTTTPRAEPRLSPALCRRPPLATQPQVNGLPPWRTRACLRFPASSTKCSPLPRKRSTFSTEESSGDSRVSLMTNSILPKIRDAVTQDDFNKVDGWLIKRLGDFFDKDLHFEDVKQVQAAIHLVLTKAQDIYSKAQKALNSRYNFDFAAAYMKNTTSTALLDVNFDLQQPAAAGHVPQGGR